MCTLALTSWLLLNILGLQVMSPVQDGNACIPCVLALEAYFWRFSSLISFLLAWRCTGHAAKYSRGKQVCRLQGVIVNIIHNHEKIRLNGFFYMKVSGVAHHSELQALAHYYAATVPIISLSHTLSCLAAVSSACAHFSLWLRWFLQQWDHNVSLPFYFTL